MIDLSALLLDQVGYERYLDLAEYWGIGKTRFFDDGYFEIKQTLLFPDYASILEAARSDLALYQVRVRDERGWFKRIVKDLEGPDLDRVIWLADHDDQQSNHFEMAQQRGYWRDNLTLRFAGGPGWVGLYEVEFHGVDGYKVGVDRGCKAHNHALWLPPEELF